MERIGIFKIIPAERRMIGRGFHPSAGKSISVKSYRFVMRLLYVSFLLDELPLQRMDIGLDFDYLLRTVGDYLLVRIVDR